MHLSRRDLFIILTLALIVIGITIYQFSIPAHLYGAVIDPPSPRPNFTLQSKAGPVSLSSLHGKLVILYFGYTSCPDVCPLTLAHLRQAIEKLGSNASQVQVIFISVDWKRDTPEKLSAYTNAFHSEFIGLTGTKAQIDSVTKDYGIFYLLNLPDSQGYYSVDHTATMQVLDRQGNLVLTWPNGIESDEITSDLRSLLRKFATTTP